MQTYQMRRWTIVAPHVRNDGTVSGYPAALRDALMAAGIDGWTETETHGYWHGKREAGVTFDIMLPWIPYPSGGAVLNGDWYDIDVVSIMLGRIARSAMGDEQEAIQVTAEPGIIELLEA